MSLKSLVAQTWLSSDFWVHSVPQFYAAGAHNVFNIVGGPVWIRALVEYNDTAKAAATLTNLLVGAVGLDVTGAPVSIQAGINTMVVSPLNVVVAKIAPALAVQMPSLTGFATNIGLVASPGVAIILTLSGAAMGAAETMSLYVCYQKLTPESLITLA